MQATNSAVEGATAKGQGPTKAPGPVSDGTKTTSNKTGPRKPTARVKTPVSRTELSRGKVPAAAKRRVAVKTTTNVPAQHKDALAPAPIPAHTGPIFKPGQIALRHGVPFVLHNDGTWQRHIFASVVKGEAPVEAPIPGARGRRARAHLPGAIFATPEHEVVIGEDGVGRPLEPDHAPRPAHLCYNEVWPSAEPHLPSNLVRIGGRLNQLLPDGTWRRVVVSVAAAAAPTTTTPVAPSPPPSRPSPSPSALAAGTFVPGAQGVQYMLHSDGTWRPLDASLSAALGQPFSAKFGQTVACSEEGCVWDEGNCAAPSADPATPESAPETPASSTDDDAIVESALPTDETASSTTAATTTTPGPAEAVGPAMPAMPEKALETAATPDNGKQLDDAVVAESALPAAEMTSSSTTTSGPVEATEYALPDMTGNTATTSGSVEVVEVVEPTIAAAELTTHSTTLASGPVEAIEPTIAAAETTGSTAATPKPVKFDVPVRPVAEPTTGTTNPLADPTVPAFVPAPALAPAPVPAPEPKKPRTGTRRHRGRRGPSEQEIQQRVEQELQRRLGQLNIGGAMAPVINMNIGGWGMMPQQGYGYGPMYGQGPQGGYGYGEPYAYLG